MQTGLALTSQLPPTVGPQQAPLTSPINLLFPLTDDHSFFPSFQTTCIASTPLNFNRTSLPTNSFSKELRLFFSEHSKVIKSSQREFLFLYLMFLKFRSKTYYLSCPRNWVLGTFPSFSIGSPVSREISQS